MMSPLDHARPLVASGNLRRRNLVNRLVEASATIAAIIAVAVLGVVVYSIVERGGSALSLDFLIKDPLPAFSGPGGGIAPAIVGTGLLVLVATAVALPLGVLIAIYLTEFAGPRTASAVRLMLDLLNGLPSIVIGLFVFGLLVVGHPQTGFAGSFALAIIMLPIIARSSQEVLLVVPQNLREAARALGVSRWRTVLGVVLPSALGGILTGAVLAVARAAGETAPLILTSSIFANNVTGNIFGEALPNIPVSIFSLSESPDPVDHARAWGSALVLMAFILVAITGARALHRRFDQTQARLSRR